MTDEEPQNPPQDLSTSGPLWTQTLSSSDSFMPVFMSRELSILNSLSLLKSDLSLFKGPILYTF